MLYSYMNNSVFVSDANTLPRNVAKKQKRIHRNLYRTKTTTKTQERTNGETRKTRKRRRNKENKNTHLLCRYVALLASFYMNYYFKGKPTIKRKLKTLRLNNLTFCGFQIRKISKQQFRMYHKLNNNQVNLHECTEACRFFIIAPHQ